jgi:hypothetical protein
MDSAEVRRDTAVCIALVFLYKLVEPNIRRQSHWCYYQADVVSKLGSQASVKYLPNIAFEINSPVSGASES